MKLNSLKSLGLISALALTAFSCNKINSKKIVIEDKLSSKSLKNITEIKLDGVPESDYVMFGGDYGAYKSDFNPNIQVQNFSVKHPYAHFIEGKNSIYLRANLEYTNEFYVIRKQLKKDVECTTEDDNKNFTKVTLKKDKFVTFVWSATAGARGWYQYFVEKEGIDDLVNAEVMYMMRVATNKTKMKITDTDNVTVMSSAFEVKNNEMVPIGDPAPAPKPVIFEPKQRIAVCSMFHYPGKGNMRHVNFETIMAFKDEQKVYDLASRMEE